MDVGLGGDLLVDVRLGGDLLVDIRHDLGGSAGRGDESENDLKKERREVSGVSVCWRELTRDSMVGVRARAGLLPTLTTSLFIPQNLNTHRDGLLTTGSLTTG